MRRRESHSTTLAVTLLGKMGQLLTMGSLIALGCRSDSTPPTASVSREQRLTTLRKQLKRELREDYDRPIPNATTEQLRRGFQLYDLTCASCHGRRGRGDGRVAEQLLTPPGDLTDAERAAFFSDRARLEIIRRGIPGTPMVGWDTAFDDEELVAVFLATRYLMRAGSPG